MRLTGFFSLILAGHVLADHIADRASDASVDAFIASESKIALQGILNNIGGSGSKAEKAHNGVVIASPSDDPDYK